MTQLKDIFIYKNKPFVKYSEDIFVENFPVTFVLTATPVF